MTESIKFHLNPISVTGILANNSFGSNGQVLTSDGTNIHWKENPITLNANITYLPYEFSIGYTPNNTRYEVSSGGQLAYTPSVVQIASVGNEAPPTNLELYRFEDTGKPVIMTLGKNRGDGNTASSDFSKKTLGTDRLAMIAFYGSKDANSSQTAFAHAGYITVTADGVDNTGVNEQDSFMSLLPGYSAGYYGALGVGLQLNSKSQASVSGPYKENYISGDDYGAIFKIGPGSTTMPPLGLTCSDLTTTPVIGAIELSPAGQLQITANDSIRREIVTASNTAPSVAVLAAAGTGASAVVTAWAPNSCTITLTMGSSGVSAGPTNYATVTYPNSYETASVVTFAAGSVTATRTIYVTPGTEGFDIGIQATVNINTVYILHFQWSGR